jgi:hypothetical protein
MMALIIVAGRLVLGGVKPLFKETWSTVYEQILKALFMTIYPGIFQGCIGVGDIKEFQVAHQFPLRRRLGTVERDFDSSNN